MWEGSTISDHFSCLLSSEIWAKISRFFTFDRDRWMDDRDRKSSVLYTKTHQPYTQPTLIIRSLKSSLKTPVTRNLWLPLIPFLAKIRLIVHTLPFSWNGNYLLCLCYLVEVLYPPSVKSCMLEACNLVWMLDRTSVGSSNSLWRVFISGSWHYIQEVPSSKSWTTINRYKASKPKDYYQNSTKLRLLKKINKMIYMY